jgi:hypothetical protein
MSTDSIAPELMTQLAEMRSKIDEIYSILANPKDPEREWYSVEEAAKIIDKSEFTTRQWANLGRINAEKRADRRGASALWRISASEIRRYKEEGLLPINPNRNRKG